MCDLFENCAGFLCPVCSGVLVEYWSDPFSLHCANCGWTLNDNYEHLTEIVGVGGASSGTADAVPLDVPSNEN